MKRSSANRGPEALDRCPQIQRLYSAVGHPPALRWSQLLEVKVRRRGPPDVDTCGRRLLGPVGIGSARIQPVAGFGGYAWVHYRVFQVDPSVHIAISTAVIRRPRPSEFPTREFISQGVFGRSCFRATPAWSTRSRRGVNVRDALRAVYLTEATEPEHCRRVQIVVGKLPGLPGNRTWSFGPWRSNQGMGQHERKGDEAPSAGRRPTVVAVRTWVRGAMGRDS